MNEKNEPRVLCVIPARWASTRIPGKPLALIGEVPMVEWVARGVSEAQRVDEIVIATDDERVRDVAESYGRKAVITNSARAPTGWPWWPNGGSVTWWSTSRGTSPW